MLGSVVFALLISGCADMYYADTRANRTPEARYNTYYAPDYYPYYPWDSYYGGAYLLRGVVRCSFFSSR